MAHGANHGETITGVRHVQVGEQYIKALCSDATERFAYARHGDYIKAVAFQCCPQHSSDGVVVLG
jgi:hypothetical protein